MNSVAATIMSICMLAALVLIGFGLRFAFKSEHRKHGGLMILVGLILVANVLIWTL